MLKIDGFDWDEGNLNKIERKHGISRELIEALFRRKHWVELDLKHSKLEERYLAIGTDPSGRPMLVVFTFRLRFDSAFIRPISARYMHEKEVQKYAKTYS